MQMKRMLTDMKFALLGLLGTEEARDLENCPDFLGIGVPQGATTWLYENMRQHPEVYFPGKKELNYFTNRFIYPFSWYKRAFEEGKGLIKGEITAGYCALSKNQVEIVHQYLPEVKIFLNLRHPIDRVWSAARRVLGWKYERLEDAPDDAFIDFFKRADVRSRTDYPRILDNWKACYGPNQVLVTFFEEMKVDPEGVLRKIFRHIGASTDLTLKTFPLKKKVNSNPRLEIPERFRAILEERYRKVINEVNHRFGESVTNWD